MTVLKKDWEYESKRLKEVYGLIQKDIEERGENTRRSKNEIVSMRKSFWDVVANSTAEIENVIEIAQKVNQLDIEQASYIHKQNTLNKLSKLKSSPYFARVDFTEKGTDSPEKIYIGISSFINIESGIIYIYDWRSPISSIFYEYEMGPAVYSSPSGKIEGDISLKRQFKITEDVIHYMFDSSVKIDDDILQEILGKSVDDKMKNIVATIQKEQNRIIRDDNNQLLIVQGAAGSGKTSIALHRIAYLLYKYRDSAITSDNLVIFSPNQMFNDYISNVLPELGEENINQTTFYEYTKKFIEAPLRVEDPIDQLEYILSNINDKEYNTRISSIKYKGSDEFLKVLRNYVKYIEKEMFHFDDIVFDGHLIISRAEIEKLFHEDYKISPILKRLYRIKDRIYLLLNEKKKVKLKELEKTLSESEDVNDNPRVAARLTLMNETRSIMGKIDSMTSFDVLGAYLKLFEDKKLFERISAGTKVPENWDDIRWLTLNSLASNYVYSEDAPAYMYIKNETFGAPNLSRIKHIVIDEAQDYTSIQYEIFRQLFSSCSMTILGDLNQSIHPYMHTGNYEGVLDIFNIPNSSIFKLFRSYRSIKEIVEFTKAILPRGERIEYINRYGEKPLVINVLKGQKHEELILDDIEKLLHDGCNSIAVICKNQEESSRVYKELLKQITSKELANRISLVSQDSSSFTSGVVVIPSYLSKGLEFDGVIVYDAGLKSYSKEDERKLFYTICTRALHKLHLFYEDEITPFIADIDKNLYTIIK